MFTVKTVQGVVRGGTQTFRQIYVDIIKSSNTETENALKVTLGLSPSYGRVKTAKTVLKKICVIAV